MFNTKCSCQQRACKILACSVCVQTYFDVIHVGIFELFLKVGIFLEVLNDFPEVAVVVQPSLLKRKPKLTLVFVDRGLKSTFNLISNLT